jgi:hypothetical protein
LGAGPPAPKGCFLREPFAKLLVGLRQIWLTTYIHYFNQLGTAQAEACGYLEEPDSAGYFLGNACG